MVLSASGAPQVDKKLTPFDPQFFTAQFGQNQGHCDIQFVAAGGPMPSVLGNVAQGSYLGEPSPYYINGGKLVTSLAGTPIESTIYKLGDKHLGARSDEFGFANYEVIEPPAVLVDLKEIKLPPGHDAKAPLK